MNAPAIRLPQAVCEVIERLESCGHTAWAVGGCVRDSLRGVCPSDWDLTTSAAPEQIQTIFPHVRLTGVQHGTVTVLHAGMALEVTTYRGESSYTDGRRPDRVRFLSRVEDDLARRDFTINAMAYHAERGLCDPFGGQSDLQNGVLRAVGKADTRFAEDALRILRGVRFVGKTGFQMEEQTADAMYRQMYRLETVAAERVFAELDALLTSRYVGRALRQYRAVLAVVLPEIAPMFGLCQHNPHHRYDVWEHTVRAVEAVPAQSCLRWAMLLHDSGKPSAYTIDEAGVGHFYGHPDISCPLAEQVMTRLHTANALRKEVANLVLLHDRPIGQTERQVRRFLAKHGETCARRLLSMKKADCTGQDTFSIHLQELQQTELLLNHICAQAPCLTLHELAINGHTLCQMGLSGPSVGAALNWLLAQVIEGQIPNEPDALRSGAAQWKENQHV